MKRYTAEQMQDLAQRLEDSVPIFCEATGIAAMLKQAASDQDLLRRLVEADLEFDAADKDPERSMDDYFDAKKARCAVLAEAEASL